jgi:hypothetical protein
LAEIDVEGGEMVVNFNFKERQARQFNPKSEMRMANLPLICAPIWDQGVLSLRRISARIRALVWAAVIWDVLMMAAPRGIINGAAARSLSR